MIFDESNESDKTLWCFLPSNMQKKITMQSKPCKVLVLEGSGNSGGAPAGMSPVSWLARYWVSMEKKMWEETGR